MVAENKSKPEVLANWKYEPDLWRDFLEYESGIYKGSVRAAKHLFLGVLIFTVVVIFLIVFITLLITDKWNLEILEFYTINHIKITKGRTREDFETRVPIPFGKEPEAEKIMNRLRARLLAANNEWIKENFALGHDFSMGICRKCGEAVAESAAF